MIILLLSMAFIIFLTSYEISDLLFFMCVKCIVFDDYLVVLVVGTFLYLSKYIIRKKNVGKFRAT